MANRYLWLAGAIADAVYRSVDSGATWEGPMSGPSGQSFLGGIGFDPDNNNLWVSGASPDAVYRSTDYGSTWETGVPGPSGGVGVSFRGMAFHPTTGDLWVTDADGNELFRSTDNGANWGSAISGPTGQSALSGITFDPDNGDLWVCGTSPDAIYKSTDNGANWGSAISGPTGQSGINGIAFDPDNGDLWVCGTSPVAIYKSTDNGANWGSAISGPTGENDVRDIAFDTRPFTKPSFSDNTGTPIIAMVGDVISDIIVPEATGLPTPTYASEGSLPTGVTFDSTDRTLSFDETLIEVGSGTIVIRATNNQGNSDWTVGYTISPDNQPPSVVIDTPPTTVDGSDTIAILATATDPDDNISAYLWTGSGTFAPDDTEDTMWTAPAGELTDRTYTLRLTVMDDDGLMARAEVDMTVRAHREDPEFADDTGTPITGRVGGEISDVVVPEASGAPIPTYAAVGSLPNGVTFSPTTRTLSFDEDNIAVGSGTITIRATNSEGSDDWTVAYTFLAALALADITYDDEAEERSDRFAFGAATDEFRELPANWMESGVATRVRIETYLFNNGNVTLLLRGETDPLFGTVGPELSEDCEDNLIITWEDESGDSVSITGITGSDRTEPYRNWTPSNSAEVVAFVNQLTANELVTITLQYDAPAAAPNFDDDTGDAISGVRGTAIPDVIVPEASGSPTPTYTVIGSLPSGATFTPGTRTLSFDESAIETDSGTITIRATNDQGSDDWTVDYTFVSAEPVRLAGAAGGAATTSATVPTVTEPPAIRLRGSLSGGATTAASISIVEPPAVRLRGTLAGGITTAAMVSIVEPPAVRIEGLVGGAATTNAARLSLSPAIRLQGIASASATTVAISLTITEPAAIRLRGTVAGSVSTSASPVAVAPGIALAGIFGAAATTSALSLTITEPPGVRLIGLLGGPATAIAIHLAVKDQVRIAGIVSGAARTSSSLVIGRVPILPDLQQLLGAQIGQQFSFVLPEATGGNTPLVYSISAGLLAWMNFNANTRTFSGTGPATGMFALTYRVEDSDGDFDTADFVLAVLPADSMPVLPAVPNIFIEVGQPFSRTLPAPVAFNLPITLEVDGRPAAVDFDPSSRILSGTINIQQQYDLIYRVTDADGDMAEQSFRLVAYATTPTPGTPAITLPPGVPGALTITEDNIGQTWFGISDWELPTTGGQPSGYDIEYRKRGDPMWIPWPHDGIERTTLITGLERGAVYEVRIRAKNISGESDWNPTTEVVTRSRTALHSTLIESAFAADTDQVWLVLLTIDHQTLPEPIRVVNNLTDITSRGETYTACPFSISLPSQDDSGVPEAQVQIENVSQELIPHIREVDSELSVTVELIRADAPDAVEQSFEDFALKTVRADETTIEGTLGLSDTILTAIPVYTFSPSFFPGLFRTVA